MTLQELSEALNIPPRQIRFMIAEGCLPPAKGTGRGADAYDEIHLDKGRRYITLHGLGMKPQAIKVLMAFDDAVPIESNCGLTLRLIRKLPTLIPPYPKLQRRCAPISQRS